MTYAKVRGVRLNYRVFGECGPWIALSPGGRRGMDEIAGLASALAPAGYRVLIHDRRNTGSSELSFDGAGSEFEIWADDLFELLNMLGAQTAIIGGSSSGCRLSILLALRHPEMVRALLMMRVTGGEFAVRRLSRRYYTDYIEAAQNGGMDAVARTEHFRALIAINPSNAARLSAIDPAQFIATMERWRDALEEGLTTPVLGASEQDLRSLAVPTCIIPGNDNTHSLEVGRLAHRLIAGSEIHELRPDHQDVDIVPMAKWVDDETLAAVFVDFLKRRVLSGQSTAPHRADQALS